MLLPTTMGDAGGGVHWSRGMLAGLSSGGDLWQRRKELDLDLAFWTVSMLLRDPDRVMSMTQNHKVTRNRWAREDVSFSLVLAFFVAVFSVGFSVAVGGVSVGALVRSVVVGELCFLAGGGLVATTTTTVANQFLRLPVAPHSVEQAVEWAYAFDVHCNASVPALAILGILLYLALPFAASSGHVSDFVANTIVLAAAAVYTYFSFRGFLILPFVGRAQVFLYPIAAILLAWIIAMVFSINLVTLYLHIATGM